MSGKIIDLFCGAGGFSLGAHLAGFEIGLAVDIDKTLTSQYVRNFPGTKLLLTDLAKADPISLLEEAGICQGELTGIVGGPPCQGFSLMGKRSRADPRNRLIKHFFRLVSAMRPKFFLMENVPGLILGDARLTLAEGMTLVTDYHILGPVLVNAADYGAATNRDRVLVLGLRSDQHFDPELISKAKIGTRATVRDAIFDVPSPKKTGVGKYSSVHVRTLSTYARAARALHPKLGDAETIDLLKNGRVTGLLPTRHATAVMERFSRVPPGRTDSVSRCPRLKWDDLAPTLRAGTGPDRGSFQSIRPLHPTQDRVITVREAARLQGFPDWFAFHETKWHSFRMIGNSVSPKLSQAVLSQIRQLLQI